MVGARRRQVPVLARRLLRPPSLLLSPGYVNTCFSCRTPKRTRLETCGRRARTLDHVLCVQSRYPVRQYGGHTTVSNDTCLHGIAFMHSMPRCPTAIPVLFSATKKARFFTYLFFLLTHFQFHFKCSFCMLACLTKRKFLENLHIVSCRLIKKKKMTCLSLRVYFDLRMTGHSS